MVTMRSTSAHGTRKGSRHARRLRSGNVRLGTVHAPSMHAPSHSPHSLTLCVRQQHICHNAVSQVDANEGAEYLAGAALPKRVDASVAQALRCHVVKRGEASVLGRAAVLLNPPG